ncbi:MAG: hypothetical protein LBF37_00740 [Rickettsiales bacterium]|jgi:inorganic pyrophosphatase/exopolyphosphatase|nr:hypothetical protein [Rickettsiales bacterium]
MATIKNYVCSYVNPNLDGTACGIALANLLSVILNEKWVPVYRGVLDCESEHVLHYLGIPDPVLVNDVGNADKIALVDTHHILQLGTAFPTDKVTFIFDHHPNGDNDKFSNALVKNETIGAAASLIADEYFKAQILDEKMLRLLGFAIASNTVNFTVATTSDYDRDIFTKITQLYPISTGEIKDMLHSRANILKRGAYAAAKSDIKIFDTPVGKVGISQLGFPGLNATINIEEMKGILSSVAGEMNLDYFLMNAGDAEEDTSIVISANSKTTELLRNHFNKAFENDWQKFDKMLLRKKDFLFK